MNSRTEKLSYCKALLVIQMILPLVVLLNVIGVLSIPVDFIGVILCIECLMAALSLVFVCAAAGKSVRDDNTGKAVISEAEAGGADRQAGNRMQGDGGMAADNRTEHEMGGISGDGAENGSESEKAAESENRLNSAGTGEPEKKGTGKAQSGQEQENSAPLVGEKYQYSEAGTVGTKFYSKEPELDTTLPKKVLIVDDSITTLKLLSAFLKKMNIEASMAKSGQEAIEAVQRERYALILMDHMMKGRDGLDTVKTIRQLKDEYYRQVPIVDVLPMGMEQYETILNDEYYQAYLTKPIDYELLQQVMITYGLYSEE
ncbi:MAG: response regulator [Lachnospiraceae bacterium]|nr:response regulator [Lachnospiraceae bacterium]